MRARVALKVVVQARAVVAASHDERQQARVGADEGAQGPCEALHDHGCSSITQEKPRAVNNYCEYLHFYLHFFGLEEGGEEKGA